MGTGWIAERFVDSLHRHSSQQVLAVGSRSTDTADAFAQRFALPRAYGNYEALVHDPNVDVIYIATPHNAHLPCAQLSIQADKNTLIEKPLALNAAQGRAIAEAAQARGLFCMEAYWTAFLPKFDIVRQILATDLFGEITSVVADFGEWFPPDHRIFRQDLAGGPMLDLATYLVSFAVDVLGTPDQITASGTPTAAGVLGQTAMIMTRGVQQAVLHTTILANTPTAATVAGTRATLSIDGPFYQPGGFTLNAVEGRGRLRHIESSIAHQGLHYQAAEVARRISCGETGSPLRPLARSIEVLEVMDEVRRQTNDLLPDE
jgi:predicted dehydrogenase